MILTVDAMGSLTRTTTHVDKEKPLKTSSNHHN